MTPREPSLQDLRDPLMLLAVGFGSGLAPRAPGTAGSLAGLVLYFTLMPWAWLTQVIGVAIAVGIGIPLCGIAARRLDQHDHRAIVWDELACVPVALAGVPVELAWIAAAWITFRVLDVTKPWPIGWLDRRLAGGVGIMADDLAAAGVTVALSLVAQSVV